MSTAPSAYATGAISWAAAGVPDAAYHFWRRGGPPRSMTPGVIEKQLSRCIGGEPE